MNRILIIDGHNLLFQMFFGMPSKIIGAKGQAIHGVIGFIGALNRLAESNALIAPIQTPNTYAEILSYDVPSEIILSTLFSYPDKLINSAPLILTFGISAHSDANFSSSQPQGN